MSNPIKIAIIGDYNFAYHSHNATNQALQHCESIFETPINLYWLTEEECCTTSSNFIDEYDGVLLAPGPYKQPFYLISVIQKLYGSKIPVLGTGDCFKLLIEDFFNGQGYNLKAEKIISDNLVEGNHFNAIQLDNFSPEFKKLFKTRSGTEYSSSRFSMLPQYADLLLSEYEICARNQYFDPEIIRKKNHPFYLFTMFCPQMVSSADLPHPVFTFFIEHVIRMQN